MRTTCARSRGPSRRTSARLRPGTYSTTRYARAVDPLDAVAAGDIRADDLRQGPALLGLARWAVSAVVALQHDVAFEIGVEGQVRGRLATGFGEAAARSRISRRESAGPSLGPAPAPSRTRTRAPPSPRRARGSPLRWPTGRARAGAGPRPGERGRPGTPVPGTPPTPPPAARRHGRPARGAGGIDRGHTGELTFMGPRSASAGRAATPGRIASLAPPSSAKYPTLPRLPRATSPGRSGSGRPCKRARPPARAA